MRPATIMLINKVVRAVAKTWKKASLLIDVLRQFIAKEIILC
jgi:hypothetical protein